MPQNTQSLLDQLSELWNTAKLELAAQLFGRDSERIDPNQQPARALPPSILAANASCYYVARKISAIDLRASCA